MKNLSVFQLVFLGIFFLFVIAGFIMVALYTGGGGDAEEIVYVEIWGTLDAGAVDNATRTLMESAPNVRLSYTQKSETSFNRELVEAIAIGSGPDVILVKQDSIVENLNKSIIIPFDFLPARDFKDSFIEESEILLVPEGIIAVPFAVDPLVMYWNRDIFSRANIANPPRYWDEVFSLALQLTNKDSSGGVLQSAAGLGEYGNIKNAKAILSAMFIQAGTKISSWNLDYSSMVMSFEAGATDPGDVLSFYTQFADSRKTINTWSRALPDSESMFLGNRLAMYYGFSSELGALKLKSPNLNVDVAMLPQSRMASINTTFGNLYSFMVLKTARDPNASIQVSIALSSKKTTDAFMEISRLPSVRKDSVPSTQDPYQKVFSQSALVSRAWIDPNRTATDFGFRDMIESVTSGFAGPSDALGAAIQQMNSQLR